MAQDGDWDRWWQDRLSGRRRAEVFPYLPTFIHHYNGRDVDPVNRDDLLVSVMAEYGLRTMLCAGHGVSQEPRALAAVGLDVTSLDISSAAVQFAQAFRGDSRHLGFFSSPPVCRPIGGGFHVASGSTLAASR